MWFFKRKVKRYIAFTLLIVFVQSLFAPAISNALTTGPHQPEYIAFTDPGSTDLVDLITGDFSFNLPLLDIPGPEGGFSLPLSYSAGINTDQESSWVGLGWSLNAGSITRTVNEFPDDANGELNTITVKDLTGVRGWEASLFGIGKMGWNNQAGHYGGLSILGIINAEWTEDYSSVGVAGFNVTSNGLDVDPIQLGITIATIISWGAVSSAASGAALASGATASEASAMATAAVTKAIATQAVVGVAMDGFFSMALGGGGPNAPTAGYWKYDTYKRNTFFGLGNVKEYRIWLDQTRSEQMYGTLYLGNIPTTTFSGSGTNLQVLLKNGGVTEPLYVFQNSNNSGAASDINYQAAPNQENLQFHEINNPVALAPDYYSVNAVGISGTIRPYRLDVGAVSMPRQMTKYHDRMATVKYVTNDASYKVPFIYNGQRSNVYFHHVGASSAVSSPTFYFGLNTILANSSPPSNTSITYDINDLVLKNQRIRTDLNTYKKIPQANYIEWLSNNEIRSSMTYASKFMDYFSGGTGSTVSTSSDRYQFRSTLPIGSMTAYTYTTGISPTIPINPSDMSKFSVNDVVDLNISLYANQASAESGTTSNNPTITSVVVNGVGASSITINDSRLTPYYGQYANIEIVLSKSPSVLTAMGGFCITAADGTTYHFALPTYDYDQYTEMRDVSDPNNKKSIIKRTSPFANTWVITAITGSDFVDRNSNGIVDDSDWGHWVKFNYGFHMNNYKYRFPYTDGVYKKTPASTYESFTEGKKQLLYLNSIETRSHVGLFLKSSRSDGKSANTTVSQFPLKLDEIVLVSKEHYQKMVKPTAQGGFGITDFSNKSNYVLLSANITAGLRDFLNQNCLRRVVFGYATSNSLAQGTLNSTGGGGKLTLSRLSVFGKVSKKIVPDYLFEYANNPAYGENYWDGFGMYNPSGTSAGSTHNPSTTDSDGSAWSLTKITTPLGSEINVNYERDTYYSVAGNTISEAGASFSNLNFDLYYPTYFPITKLTVNNPSSYFVVGDSVRVSGYATYYCSNNPVTQNKTFTKDARIVAVGSNYIDLGVDYMNLNCTLNTSGQYIHFDAQAGQVSAPLKNRKGGDIRVGSLVVRDEFGNENKVRYLYKNDDGTSSGVLAKLPQYVIGPYQNAQDYLNFPTTPVMYRRVTVLGGKLSNDNDFTSKYVYDFETPDQSQLSLVQSVIKQNELIGTNVLAKDYQSIYWNRYEDRTSKIGRLKSVRVYDNAGNLYSSSILSYTDQMLNNGINNYQGVYTDGAIMFDRAGNNVIEKYHKINRTTTIHYPYVLKKITNTKDGFTTVSENLSWDLYTGSELEKVIR
ncbi:MAG TPA: hypothetical protein VFW11_00645, partial [Cyclobacteriaceae bacterium]|nr:hypothetical protein [Cyclobacteriaceae bacterium]